MNSFHFPRLAGIVFLTAGCVLAQTSLGTIAGVVTDPMGAPIEGATVHAKNNTGGDDRTVKTESNGGYRVDAVTPSTYTITITKDGFSTKEIKDVTVPASVVTSANAELALGSLTQTVTV